MNWESRYIKKLMGWCPNAKAHEARQPINFESFDSGISSRTGRNDGNQKNLGWFQKTNIQTFLINTFLTLASLLVINQLGINLFFLLAGSLISLFFIIFDWNAQMRRYDTLVKHPVIDYSDKKKLYYILACAFILTYHLYIKGHGIAMQAMFSSMGGLMVGMWIIYFQLIYWEKKNHKTIYFGKKHGTWKTSHIIREKE